jgi:hypothetical protein
VAGGYKHSDETKERLRAVMIGKKLTPEHKAKISASRRGGIPAHGTTARYQGNRRRDACRCDRCRTAWSERNRRRRVAKLAGTRA